MTTKQYISPFGPWTSHETSVMVNRDHIHNENNVWQPIWSTLDSGDPFFNNDVTWPLTCSLAGRLTLSKSSYQYMAAEDPNIYETIFEPWWTQFIYLRYGWASQTTHYQRNVGTPKHDWGPSWQLEYPTGILHDIYETISEPWWTQFTYLWYGWAIQTTHYQRNIGTPKHDGGSILTNEVPY